MDNLTQELKSYIINKSKSDNLDPEIRDIVINLLNKLNKNDDQLVEILDSVHYAFCGYGKPSGPDDYCSECDCGFYDV